MAAKPGKAKKPRTRRKAQPKRILNCKPSPKVDEDWTLENAQASELVAARPRIPGSKDLRAQWWGIGDQSQTGSCVGWATADAVLRWHFVKAGRLAKSDRLSPRFVWMASKETDQFISRPTTFIETEGTSLKSALDIARKFGAVPDKLLPFSSGKLYPGDWKTFYAVATKLKVGAYFNLGTNLTSWRVWLATMGPILTRLDVDDTWYDASSANGDLDEYQADATHGGHAVALVGYKPGRFIVRNSWGTGWGDKGFGYASLAYAQRAFTEAYGVSV